MASFKHHSYFPKARAAQLFLFPHVCFNCRKSFKKPASDYLRVCPQCASPLARLSRKFKTPPSKDRAQWIKVKFLVDNGFLFYSAFERTERGSYRVVPYPKTLDEARSFVESQKTRCREVSEVGCASKCAHQVANRKLGARSGAHPTSQRINLS